MRGAILVCVLALLLPFASPAYAFLTVGHLRAVCGADKIKNDGACQAFFRGGIERQAVMPRSPDPSPVVCRSTPLAEEDFEYLLDGYNSHSDAAQLIVPHALKSAPSCLDAPGTWSNARLGQACREDAAGICRFYLAGALLEAGVTARLRGQRAFCYRREDNHVMSEFELLGDPSYVLADIVLRWMNSHPVQAKEPAAKWVVEIFAAAFPCREDEKQIVFTAN